MFKEMETGTSDKEESDFFFLIYKSINVFNLWKSL